MDDLTNPKRTEGEPPIDDPCVVFALRRESQAFRQYYALRHRRDADAAAPCWVRSCDIRGLQALILETGVGQARTAAAMDWLLGQPQVQGGIYRPSFVLAAGFGGGLNPAFQCGDVVVATQIIEADTGKYWQTSWPGAFPIGNCKTPLHRGPLVTSPRLVATPEAKQTLAGRHGAIVVDMESAAVARLCSERGVPFGCVRVVLDDAGSPLSPRLIALLSSGRASPLKLAAHAVSSPALLGELWQLARQSRLAARRLAAALGELLPLTVPRIDRYYAAVK